jgi:hypothetical protein
MTRDTSTRPQLSARSSRAQRATERLANACQSALGDLQDHNGPVDRPLQFIPITDLDALRTAGILYPATVHGWRWIYRVRHERGLADAFRRIGRRVVVNPARFAELVRIGVAQ